ncbi:MAG: hypothetical protein AAF649_08730 [Verrucomicrobiota bacterium]
MHNRRWLLIGLCACLSVSCCVIAYPYLKTRFLIGRALENWNQGNYIAAEQWAYRAHLSQKQNIKAMGMLGDSLRRRGSPAAIYYKRQVAEMMPHTDDAWLDLAGTALDMGYTQAAADALGHVQHRERSDYRNLTGAVLLQQNRIEAAMSHFAAALAASDSGLAHYNWAAVALISSSGTLDPDALDTMMELQRSESFRLAASRIIAQGYVQTGQLQLGIPYLHVLLQAGTVSDQHFALSQLIAAKEPMKDILNQIDTPQVRLYLSARLRDQERLDAALEMLAPALDSGHAGVLYSHAELLHQTGSTRQALAALQTSTGVIPDLLRWKFSSTPTNQPPVLGALGPYLRRRDEMQVALEMLSRWQLSRSITDVYSELVKDPGEQGSFDYLNGIDYLLQQDDILAAYQLSQSRYEVSGSSISGNNYAYLALVLGLHTERTEQLIQKLYQQHQEVSSISTTYLWYRFSRKNFGSIPDAKRFIAARLAEEVPRFSEEKEFIRQSLDEIGSSKILP